MKNNFQNIPVLVLGYNRPNHIKKLLNSLKKINLYTDLLKVLELLKKEWFMLIGIIKKS